MPDHKLHAIACELILGKAYPEVDKYMDQAQPLLQSNHRMLYHDKQTMEMFAGMDEMMGAAAYIHVALDAVSDKVGQDKAVITLLKLVSEGVL